LVDYFVRQSGASTVVRYNGGAQAAHNVVTAEGLHHTFAQFGSGTLAGARTHLSRFMVVNPTFLFSEAKHLAEIMKVSMDGLFDRITIERDALVTTPFHVAANRLRESLRTKKHGS